MRSTVFVLALLALFLGTGLAEEVVAVKGGRVITVSGEEFADGVVILRDGRVEAVGAGLEIPWNARVLEAKGRVVTPGLVHPHTQWGLDRPNETMPVSPFVSVIDSIDPESTTFKDALRQGITSILVAPGNQTVIGGQSAVIHPVGRYVDEMVVTRDAGMKLSVAPRRNVSRMSQMAELRRALDSAIRYRDKLELSRKKAAKEKKDLPAVDTKQEAMLRLLAGDLPAIISCDQAMDVHAAAGILADYKLTGFLVTGRECWKAAAFAKEKKLSVVLPSVLSYWDRDALSEEETYRFVAGPWREAGVTFALGTGTGSLGQRLLWYQAASLVKHGEPREAALRSVTLDAASIIGLADRLGSIEPGKDGDLVIWTGDPLSVNSWVETVIIGGKVVYEREKDEQLKELLAAEKKEAEKKEAEKKEVEKKEAEKKEAEKKEAEKKEAEKKRAEKEGAEKKPGDGEPKKEKPAPKEDKPKDGEKR